MSKTCVIRKNAQLNSHYKSSVPASSPTIKLVPKQQVRSSDGRRNILRRYIGGPIRQSCPNTTPT